MLGGVALISPGVVVVGAAVVVGGVVPMPVGGSWINVVWILLPGCGVYHVCVPLMKKTAHDGLEFCFDTKFYIIADHSCFQSYPGFLEKLSPLGR